MNVKLIIFIIAFVHNVMKLSVFRLEGYIPNIWMKQKSVHKRNKWFADMLVKNM